MVTAMASQRQGRLLAAGFVVPCLIMLPYDRSKPQPWRELAAEVNNGAASDPVFFEAAQALANRVQHEGSAVFDARLDYLFALCLNRKPDAHERERLAAYFKAQPSDTAWLGLSRVMLNVDEFITRE